LKAINSILSEKQNAKEKSGEIAAEGSPSKDETVSYFWYKTTFVI
jgi:hypothetical protein